MSESLKITGPIRLPLEVENNGSKKVDYHQLYYFEYKNERWAAVIYGDITKNDYIPLRIESACFFGHVFNSRQCDCGYQLMQAFARIREKECGLVIYGIDQDARGLGIENHFRIYDLRQNQNLDTEEVFEHLNAELDNRSYDAVKEILDFLKITKIHLLSNNVKRIAFLKKNGFDVIREELEAPLDRFNMATMMLEKEDLGYEWSFLTHAHWLKPIQDKVNGNIHQYAGCIVEDNKQVVAEWLGNEWAVAKALQQQMKGKERKESYIVYLSDLPRLDEIAIYASMGIYFMVVPFSDIPKEWRQEAEKWKVKLQDWSRENRYPQERVQWLLVERTADADIYEKNNQKITLCR